MVPAERTRDAPVGHGVNLGVYATAATCCATVCKGIDSIRARKVRAIKSLMRKMNGRGRTSRRAFRMKDGRRYLFAPQGDDVDAPII